MNAYGILEYVAHVNSAGYRVYVGEVVVKSHHVSKYPQDGFLQIKYGYAH